MATRVVVETFRNPGEPSKEGIRVRPVDGQFPATMRVSCSTRMRDRFPLGSRFEFLVVEDQRGGVPFLRVVGDPPWVPIETPSSAATKWKRRANQVASNRKVNPESGLHARAAEYPDELDEEESRIVFEGAKTTMVVNAFERNRAARVKCIQHHGAACVVCKFNFGAVYGELDVKVQ